jgi:hypothetical protein
MGPIAPTLPDIDVEEWRAKPRAERTKVLQQHWATRGFGTPYAVYLLYILKIGLADMVRRLPWDGDLPFRVTSRVGTP